jgi:type II secretory pathway component PulC
MLIMRVDVPASEPIEPSGYVKPLPKKVSEVNIRKIYENDLFGTYNPSQEMPTEPNYIAPAPPPPPPLPTHVPPEPRPQFLEPLKITLKGIIIIGSDDTKNRAIISDTKTNKEGSYKVGDIIEDAQLIKIFSNKVLFLRPNGQQEVLYLRPKDAQLDPTYAQISGWKGITQKITDNQYLINTKEFIFRINNLGQFIDLLDLTTVYQNGKSVGCKIGTIQDASFAQELGLQSGDIIHAVNGVPVVDTPSRMAIYKQITGMKTKDMILVELMRNNRPYTLQYIIGQQTDDTEVLEKQVVQLQGATAGQATQEQIKIMQERHKFAPTLQDIRSRERKIMMDKGKAPTPHQSQNVTNVVPYEQ